MKCRYCAEGIPATGSYLAVGANGQRVRVAWVECPSCHALGPLIEGGPEEDAASVEQRATNEFTNEGDRHGRQ